MHAAPASVAAPAVAVAALTGALASYRTDDCKMHRTSHYCSKPRWHEEPPALWVSAHVEAQASGGLP